MDDHAARERFFQYYQFLLINLKSLAKERNSLEQGTDFPKFKNEVRLLSLCYLDALRASSGEPSIGTLLGRFGNQGHLVNLVCTGRLHAFVRTFRSQIQSQPIDVQRIKSELKHLIQTGEIRWFLEPLIAVFEVLGTETFLLLLRALDEFSWDKLYHARKGGELILKVRNVEHPPLILFHQFTEFIKEGPNQFLAEYGIEAVNPNRERYKNLIDSEIPEKEMLKIFKLFNFDNVFRRDFRNPMVHRTLSHSQANELVEDEADPYYWFNSTWNGAVLLQVVIPDQYWINVLEQVLINYSEYCAQSAYNPVSQKEYKFW